MMERTDGNTGNAPGKNAYVPLPAVVEAIRRETFDTKTFRVRFADKSVAGNFAFRPGQFMEVSLIGTGEAPISISSSPGLGGFLEFTIRSVGKVTAGIHGLRTGDILYLRGPYGNSFPIDDLKGKNLYFIAGGIGLAPMRSLVNLVFENRQDYGRVRILYGAKTPDELCFKDELGAGACFRDGNGVETSGERRGGDDPAPWGDLPDAEVHLTVDDPGRAWKSNIGVVTELWNKTGIDPDHAVALVCGPPMMMTFAVRRLLQSGFRERDIILTLERYMKCGIGKCGHCNVGGKFICTDGPVFTYEQAKAFPAQEHSSD